MRLDQITRPDMTDDLRDMIRFSLANVPGSIGVVLVKVDDNDDPRMTRTRIIGWQVLSTKGLTTFGLDGYATRDQALITV